MTITIRNLDRSNPNHFYFKAFLTPLVRDASVIREIESMPYVEFVDIPCDDMPINQRIKIVLACMKSRYDFRVTF